MSAEVIPISLGRRRGRRRLSMMDDHIDSTRAILRGLRLLQEYQKSGEMQRKHGDKIQKQLDNGVLIAGVNKGKPMSEARRKTLEDERNRWYRHANKMKIVGEWMDETIGT